MFENFRNKCIEMCELDLVHFLSAPGLAWQACLKKTEVELELLTNTDMLLMIEKDIRGGICPAIHRHANINNKYMENYNKKLSAALLNATLLNHHTSSIYMQTICTDGKCLKNCLQAILN